MLLRKARYVKTDAAGVSTRERIGYAKIFFGLVIAAVLLAAGTAAKGQAVDPIRGLAAVREKLGQQPLVRVIATLAPAPTGRELRGAELSSAQSRFETTMREAGVAYVSPIEGQPLVVIEVDLETLDRLVASGQVVNLEEDRIEQAHLEQSGPLVGAPDVWAQGAAGQGVSIAILDSGVDAAHPFLTGKIVEEACFSSNSRASGARTVCPNGQQIQIGVGAARPCTVAGCDHGTHVAGIAAGRGNNFSGVARDAQIVAVQVFSRFDDTPNGPHECDLADLPSPCVLSFASDQIRALQFVGGRRILGTRIAAANMSLGSGGGEVAACDTDSRAILILTLRSWNVATVISSGNDGSSDSVGKPGCISPAITVGSTTKSDAVSDFSNSSDLVDLLAPGSNINSSVPGGGFLVLSGTSMAAPHVAGAFAVQRARRPNATVDDIETALKSTGALITDPRNNITKPRIDLKAAFLPFWHFVLHTGTALHVTDQTFDFDVTDWNRDGTDDLFVIKKSGTGTNTTEVFVFDGANKFQSRILETGTALHVTDQTYDFHVTDWNRDGTDDLFVIKKSGTGTNTTEVFVFDGANKFQSRLLETGTALHVTDQTFDFDVTDWNRDGTDDLFIIKKGATGTNSTEVHVVSGQ